MKKLLFILFCLATITAFGLGSPTKDIVEEISNYVKNKYCPDKRVAIWDVKVSIEDSLTIITGETDKIEAKNEFISLIEKRLPRPYKIDIKLLPEETIGENCYGIIVNSVETMRSGPSVFKDVVSQTLRGLTVKILKKEAGYYLIQSDDEYLGWVDAEMVIVGDKQFITDWKNSEKVVYDELEGIVFSQPSIKSLPVADVVLGNRFKKGKKRFGWTQVIFPDGREGWIPSRFLVGEKEYLSRKPNPDEVLATAKLFLGRPYFWGGASPKCLDCSGFMQTIFRRHGLLLPRDANMQVKIGTEVDTSNFPTKLRPGDLLFWGRSADKITHVGIYLGDWRYIHSSGQVKINSFNPAHKDYNHYLRQNLRVVKRVM